MPIQPPTAHRPSDALALLLLTLQTALEHVSVPIFAMDREGAFVWQNRAGREFRGDLLGQSSVHCVAPEQPPLALEQFARKLDGAAEATNYELTLLDRRGRRVACDISSVPLRAGGEIVGALACARPRRRPEPEPQRSPRSASLTPRQHEALRLLAEGLATDEIARRLGVARETARNHIRAVLRELGCHSRLQAVVAASRQQLI